jgi:hypothetical protein
MSLLLAAALEVSFISIQRTLHYKELCCVIQLNDERSLETIEQESYRELMQDGFSEILVGTIFLVLPAIFLQSSFLPIFVVFYVIFMPQGVEIIRKKYTYPRIGYVKLREDEPPKISLGIVVVVLLIFITIIAVFYFAFIDVIDRFFIWKWIPAVFGFIMWGPSLYLKGKTGQRAYYLPGLLMSITGVATALVTFLTAEVGTALFMVGWGLAFMVLGLIRFLLFIRKYPILDNPEDESSEQ